MPHRAKVRMFNTLWWLFEERPSVPALLVWAYSLLWLVGTYMPPSPVDPWIAYAEIGWWPTRTYAWCVLGLASYQLVCCAMFRCLWSVRLLSALFTASFVVYTSCAPMIVFLPSMPSYAAGNLLAAAAALLVVARCMRKPRHE